MNVNQDLLGKTITGVIATTSPNDGMREIWMLQFADGSHVEFVSPGARRALRQATQGATQRATQRTAQRASKPATRRVTQQPIQQHRSSGQLTLNVA
jgi:hypothetical protein